MRNNKAAKQNRNFMVLTTTLGLLVIGCVLAFWYLAFEGEAQPTEESSNTNASSDSLPELIIIDNTLE